MSEDLTPRHGKPRRRGVFVALAIVAVIGAVIALNWVAPVPQIFDPGVTFKQATARAVAEQKPLVAVITADFCMQCQIYKRGALADSRVEAWIGEHAQTAYVKWGTQADELERFNVSGFPVTILVPTVGEPKVRSGLMSADELLDFLRSSELPPLPTD